MRCRDWAGLGELIVRTLKTSRHGPTGGSSPKARYHRAESARSPWTRQLGRVPLSLFLNTEKVWSWSNYRPSRGSADDRFPTSTCAGKRRSSRNRADDARVVAQLQQMSAQTKQKCAFAGNAVFDVHEEYSDGRVPVMALSYTGCGGRKTTSSGESRREERASTGRRGFRSQISNRRPREYFRTAAFSRWRFCSTSPAVAAEKRSGDQPSDAAVNRRGRAVSLTSSKSTSTRNTRTAACR